MGDPEMYLVVGPILKQTDGYTFDSWMRGLGVHRSYSYRRIEDAYYARSIAVAEAAHSSQPEPVICGTRDEFLMRIDGASLLAA
jgi:hypothetical protein